MFVWEAVEGGVRAPLRQRRYRYLYISQTENNLASYQINALKDSTVWGAEIRRLLKIIGLFCRISSLL